jgi:hypothetical protein
MGAASFHFRPRSFRRRIAGLLFAATASLAVAAPAFAVDLTVSNVEVTQSIQTPVNSIRLIAARSTAVRATIGITGNAGGPVAGVTGVLHVFRNGVEITPAAGVVPINGPFTAPAAPQRANENDTLNFELATPAALQPSMDLDVRVDVTPIAGESNFANNSGFANDLTVVAGTTPSLFFTRINFTPAGLGLPPLSFVQAGTGDSMVRGILPVADGDPNLYRQGLFPTLTFAGNAGVAAVVDGGDIDNLLNLLESCRQLIVSNGLGATNTTFLHGWLAGNPIDGNGWARIGGRVTFGNSDPVRAQRTYAHELTHNLGFDHITNNIDQVGWDVSSRLPNNPATNNTTGRVKPTTLFDVQVPGLVTNQAWVETAKYLSLETNPALGFSSPDRGDVPKPSRRVLIVRGVLDPRGTRLQRLLPVFRYPWLSQPAERPRQARFQAEVRTVTGALIRAPFNSDLRDDRSLSRFGAFEVMIPTSAEIQSLRITDTSGERTFGRLARTKAVPRITILSPQPGARLAARTTVRWRANDADTASGRLMYQVAYSPNGGRNWVPIAVDLTKTAVTFNSTQIQRSAGRGVLRVFVSDGLNTAFADVTKLTPTRASFPAPPQQTRTEPTAPMSTNEQRDRV